MTTIALPSWFDVAECEAQLVPEVRGFTGPYGGPTEVQDLLGDRWQFRLTLPDGNHGHGAQSEALFNRLHGGADWLRLHHFARPVPRGTARGSLTLASAMAQGANTVQLSGCINANVLPGGSFEIDSNSDGLADGWTRYSAGTVGALSATRSTGVVAHGAYSQSLSAASLGSASTDRQGITRSGVDVSSLAGASAVISLSVLGTLNSSITVELAWRDNGGSVISALSTSPVAMTTGMQALQFSGACPSNAATCLIYIYQHSNTGASPSFYVDAVQLQAGTAATALAGYPTLLAGDMLGHNGEQLFQVADDAVANDAGQITLTLVNRARKAISSGQAIVWDKPQVPFQLMSPGGVATAYTRGRARGQQVEFVEAWA